MRMPRSGEIGPKHVVILGAGFGGLYAARALRRAPVRVTLIDQRNHHLFQPMLYQVATAARNPSKIAAPIRSILRRQKNTTVMLGEARSVDTRRKVVLLSHGEIPYDFLIVATGATHSYIGQEEWAEHAPGLKSIEDALRIRARALLAYEAAELEPDPERRREWLTFIIVGAGPTGVELAGALAEISHHTLAHDFRNMDPTRARILLLEGLPCVLPSYPPVLSAKTGQPLARLGVEVRTGVRVPHIDGLGVSLGDERIAARTILWCAGVAPAAVQEGRHVAQNVVRSVRGEAHAPFRYVDKGSLATIGRAAAVADLMGLKLSGLIAGLAWLAIHIFFLIDFRNRVVVMLTCAYSCLTFRRAARLITDASPGLLALALSLPGSREVRQRKSASQGENRDRLRPEGRA